MIRKHHFTSYTIYAFSPSELKHLLESCPTMADYIMILLASRYGFRRDDIVNIRINNVDLKGSTMTYHEHKKDIDRTIPIEPDVCSELTRYFNTIQKGQTYLLPFRDGSTAWRHLQEICKVAGIPVPNTRTGRPFHALRGTCVKMRQAQGWTLNEVAALIGDEVETVAQHYATVTPMELAAKMQGGK
jgi:integrase